MKNVNRFEWERHAFAQSFNGEALRVLWCYASHADAESLLTFPPIRDVAEETGISVEKVGNFRRELLAAGWLVESDQKTTRGNPKLMLAVGEPIKEKSYLGEKKAVSPRSMANLVPAAKQKKAAGSLDTPDETGLGYRGQAGLEHRVVGGLDTPDVTTSELNNPSQSISFNHDRAGGRFAPTVTVATHPLPKEDRESNPEPSMGTVWVSGTGDLLFEADTGSGVYMLSECGVDALSLPGTRTAAPVEPDPIPTDAATPSPLERELAECRRRWSMTGETGWKVTEARMAEENAIRERHGVPADAW